MSDVAAIDQLVVKHKELKKEIAKVIIGQDTGNRSDFDFYFFWRSRIINRCSRTC